MNFDLYRNVSTPRVVAQNALRRKGGRDPQNSAAPRRAVQSLYLPDWHRQDLGPHRCGQDRTLDSGSDRGAGPILRTARTAAQIRGRQTLVCLACFPCRRFEEAGPISPQTAPKLGICASEQSKMRKKNRGLGPYRIIASVVNCAVLP